MGAGIASHIALGFPSTAYAQANFESICLVRDVLVITRCNQMKIITSTMRYYYYLVNFTMNDDDLLRLDK